VILSPKGAEDYGSLSLRQPGLFIPRGSADPKLRVVAVSRSLALTETYKTVKSRAQSCFPAAPTCLFAVAFPLPADKRRTRSIEFAPGIGEPAATSPDEPELLVGSPRIVPQALQYVKST
jgi:hypothetical protein